MKPTRGDHLVAIVRQLILSTAGAVVGLLTLGPIGVAVGALASLIGLRWRSPIERLKDQRIVDLERQVSALSRRPDMSDVLVRMDVERGQRARGRRP